MASRRLMLYVSKSKFFGRMTKVYSHYSLETGRFYSGTQKIYESQQNYQNLPIGDIEQNQKISLENFPNSKAFAKTRSTFHYTMS